ncbi:MAG: hypothetical protein ACK5LR_06235 [Mangrovibacterium sp.]
MTTKILNVNSDTQVGEMDTLALSIFGKKSLLGADASELFLAAIAKGEDKRVALNSAIMEVQVRSNSRQCLVEMKTAFSNFYSYISASAALPSGSTATVAKQLLEVMKPYEKEIRLAGRQLICSSYVGSLIADLEQPGKSVLLPVIMNVSTLFDILKTAHANFVASYADYRDFRNQQVSLANATTLKAELVQIINREIVGYLNAINYADIADYAAFGEAVGSIIRSHNVRMKIRKTQRLNKQVGAEME